MSARAFRIRRERSGYLYEIPLIVFGFGIVAALLAPRLPRSANIALLATFLLLFAIYCIYNVFFPGWRPGRGPRGKRRD
ncbi:MAG: hypothetical protein BWZ10_00625 [candidate division BRC1 bacterium ADurb.BinA364]|nr:MAG: hypothetical protein BWZ10_00625 [candidate division BRC1 bacterium ADurb.BinA364]